MTNTEITTLADALRERDTARQQLLEYRQSFALCEVHTPDLWEGDGTCVLCEAVHQNDELTTARQQLAALREKVDQAHELLHDGAPVQVGASRDTLRTLTLAERISEVFTTLEFLDAQRAASDAKLATLMAERDADQRLPSAYLASCQRQPPTNSIHQNGEVMEEQVRHTITLKAGTLVHICGWPVELTHETEVSSSPGNIELVRRDLYLGPRNTSLPGDPTLNDGSTPEHPRLDGSYGSPGTAKP